MSYRLPSAKEQKTLDASRQKMQQGITEEKDILSRIMPTMAKAARDDQRSARKMQKSVPEVAREGEAYQYAGYAKGGKVSASSRADGCAQRGKTKGTMV
jgi:hypothetical protein